MLIGLGQFDAEKEDESFTQCVNKIHNAVFLSFFISIFVVYAFYQDHCHVHKLNHITEKLNNEKNKAIEFALTVSLIFSAFFI
jgi:hypothetical protein